MLNALLPFATVSLELADLLGVRFIPNSRAQQGAVGMALGDVMRFHNQGRHLERDLELARLALLTQQLRLIQRKRPDVLPSLRRRLRAGSIGDFRGARQEVMVAAKLIRSGLWFDHELEGRPDFWIRGPAGEAGVECTSVHLRKARKGDLFYKVESCLREKAAKAYAGPDVAVAIATTSIDAIAGMTNQQRAALSRAVGETSLGSAMTFTVMLNRDGAVPRFESAYRRADAPSVAPQLKATLDALLSDRPPQRAGLRHPTWSLAPPAPALRRRRQDRWFGAASRSQSACRQAPGLGHHCEVKPFLAFVFVSLATYTLLVIGVFIAGGMDTSCASDCAAWEDWMADNDPWPVAIGVLASIGAGVGAALRFR